LCGCLNSSIARARLAGPLPREGEAVSKGEMAKILHHAL
jgi:hypothetical protein